MTRSAFAGNAGGFGPVGGDGGALGVVSIASRKALSHSELVESMLKIIDRHSDRVIKRAILPHTRWKPGELSAPVASETL